MSLTQYIFIANALALVDEATSNPPHKGMKPKQRFRGHVDRSPQVVMPTRMRQLVRDDRFQLSIIETAADTGGQQQAGAEYAEKSGLDCIHGEDAPNHIAVCEIALKTSQCLYFATLSQLFGVPS
jgi:hypothetical protein